MTAAPEDVLDGFRALWSAVGLAGVVAGGLHDHGLPAGTRLPFALVRVVADQRQTTTHRAGAFLEPFIATVWLHVSEAEAGQRRTLTRLLVALDFAQRLWPANRGRCLHVRPLPPPSDPSPVADTLARDVVVVTAAWEILMQQSRPQVA